MQINYKENKYNVESGKWHTVKIYICWSSQIRINLIICSICSQVKHRFNAVITIGNIKVKQTGKVQTAKKNY